jgi:phosphoribosylpyrophosphate synthetase
VAIGCTLMSKADESAESLNPGGTRSGTPDETWAQSGRIQGPVPAGAMLLVDDMVDSRWTMTIAAYLLLKNGSGPVYPLALASTAHADE